jgi:hypothetical protein
MEHSSMEMSERGVDNDERTTTMPSIVLNPVGKARTEFYEFDKRKRSIRWCLASPRS